MSRKRSRRPPAAALIRRWSVVVGVVLVAYLYYHPLRAYLSTRHERASLSNGVARLAGEKRDLQRQLDEATSTGELAREARELGYVRPGERLFIVKGIAAWQRAHSTLAGHGG